MYHVLHSAIYIYCLSLHCYSIQSNVNHASVYVLFVEMEISQESVCDVFREASTIDWHKVVESFPSFNDSCLIKVLLLWHEGEDCKDPWIVWRKLAALIESMKDYDPRQVPEDGDPRQVPEDGISEQVKHQLGIGHKLRLLSGVGKCNWVCHLLEAE